MNPIINRLPDTIPTSYVISSSGCTGQDAAHFDSEGYRKFGRRYAVQMLSLMGYESVYAEAECGTVGNNLQILTDKGASNSAYVTANENISVPPTDDVRTIKMSITVSMDTNYYLYGLFDNSSINHNSFWLKIDEGEFELFDNMTTNGWEWLELKGYNLKAGEHTIGFAFADDSVMLDKIAVKNSQIKPVDVGEEAGNLCEADITAGFIDVNLEGYALGQNYPNPVSKSNTCISFKIPYTTYVSLKIFNSQGVEIEELAGKILYAGEHVAEYNLENLTPGIYFFTMKTDNYFASQKMIIK
jgi:hypothetical protein